MFKVRLTPHWEIFKDARDRSDAAVDVTALLLVLGQIQASGSIASAGRAVQLSYRHVWGLLRDAEKLFGAALVSKQPGRGTVLSDLALALLRADQRLNARLAPTLESLASEVESEVRKALPSEQVPIRLFASHGFAVEKLLEWLRATGTTIEVRYRNSTEALAALVKGECDLAGFHVPIGEFESQAVHHYASWLNREEHVLIQLATRCQGLFLAKGNPLGVATLKDLTRQGVRFVNRQAGSGTRMLLEMMLNRQHIASTNISGFDTAEFTHAAVAAYIASGMADVGFGIETAARRFGLDFIPLARERYFFAVKRSSLEHPTVGNTLRILRSPDFIGAIAKIPGYDATNTGEVVSLDQAFGDQPSGLSEGRPGLRFFSPNPPGIPQND
jgi:molybdate transport repressor ModE-like protein